MLKLPSQLFCHLLEYCLSYKKYRLEQYEYSQTSEALFDFERRIISKIIQILGSFVSQYGNTLQLIKKDKLNHLI